MYWLGLALKAIAVALLAFVVITLMLALFGPYLIVAGLFLAGAASQPVIWVPAILLGIGFVVWTERRKAA